MPSLAGRINEIREEIRRLGTLGKALRRAAYLLAVWVVGKVADGKLTGGLTGELVDASRKAEFLREIAEKEGIPLSQVVAIGDGANDLDMLATAGLGIAFNAKPVVREAADTTVSVPFLDAVLFIMGIRREHVESADAADPEFEGTGLIDVPGVPPV